MRLHQHFVAGIGERFYASGNHAHARFVIFNLFRNPNNHGSCSSSRLPCRGKQRLFVTSSIHVFARVFPEVDARILCVAVNLFQFRFGEVEALERVERIVELVNVARAD